MQVAIVTGASSGIGFGCATKLAEAGMAVVGAGRDEDRLATLAKAIGDPDRVATIAVDLTADDAPQRIVAAAVSRWGRVDFLINNAGVGSPKPLHETDDESLDYFLGLMLRAPFRLAREVIPHMQAGSAIINITSTFAVVGGLRGGAYSAAKGGLTALTMHIACQYGPQGIRCNAVAPGVTLTPMVATRLEDERFRKMNTETSSQAMPVTRNIHQGPASRHSAARVLDRRAVRSSMALMAASFPHRWLPRHSTAAVDLFAG